MTEENFEDYIYINKLYLRLIGLWPVQDDNANWKIYFHRFHFFIFALCLWVLLLIPMVLDVYITWGNSSALIQNLVMTIHAISICLKYTHVAANQTVFKEVLNMIKYNFDTSVGESALDEEKRIIHKRARFGRIISKLFLVCLYYYLTLMFLVPIVLGRNSDPFRKNRYPFCACFYWDQNSDYGYAVGYLLQMILGLGLAVGYNIGMDAFVFVAIWHSCGHLSILQLKLRELGNSSKFSQKSIQQLVENHIYLIRNIQTLNQLFSGLCFYQVGTSFVANCLGGFQLIVILNDTHINWHLLLMYSGLLAGNFIQVLLFCWPGQELMGQALEVTLAAYQSLWTNLSPTLSKGIFLIILRAQQPLLLSAGGVYAMTLQNFTAIVKTNLSFLSVLRAMITNS